MIQSIFAKEKAFVVVSKTDCILNHIMEQNIFWLLQMMIVAGRVVNFYLRVWENKCKWAVVLWGNFLYLNSNNWQKILPPFYPPCRTQPLITYPLPLLWTRVDLIFFIPLSLSGLWKHWIAKMLVFCQDLAFQRWKCMMYNICLVGATTREKNNELSIYE